MTASLAGVAAVARQEFRLRIRAGRWRWLLAGWFAVLFGFTTLLRFGLDTLEPGVRRGTPMYGGLMLFVLALALLVVPALAAQSVNGDRERGTLAVLQVTRLTPLEITLGKLAASWGTALVFLALTLPLVGWSMVEGGVGLLRVAAVTLIVALLLGAVCAVALAWSALLARSTTSSLLSYLSVFALTVGTLVVFGLATAVTAEQGVVREAVSVVCEGPPPSGEVDPSLPGGLPPGCREEPASYTTTVARTDRTWWLLAPNPFVVLADAAPRSVRRTSFDVDGERVVQENPLDPLSAIGVAVRDVRDGPDEPQVATAAPDAAAQPSAGPVWPYGLAANLVLGAGAVALTARRLRTPARRLPRGMRVA